MAAGANQDPAPAGPDDNRTDRATGAADDAAPPAPDDGALLGLPAELGIGQLVPPADAVAPEPADGGAATSGEEAALDASALSGGTTPVDAAPLVAGALVSLAVLVGGGGWLWWRNRDTHYWPA